MVWELMCFLASAAVLWAGARWLVRSSASLGLRGALVGSTLIAFGTSAPETAVSALASLRGHGDIALGNVLGSNLANLGMVLGLCSLVRPHVDGPPPKEVSFLLASLALLWALSLDGRLGRLDGAALLAGMGAFLVVQAREAYGTWSGGGSIWAVLGGLGLLVLGAEGMVRFGAALAHRLGVSDLTVGLTLVALGTSLPELGASLAATLAGRESISWGNVLGSNVYNCLAVAGLAALLCPLEVSEAVLARDLPLVGLYTAAVLAFSIGRGGPIRLLSLALLVSYVLYVLRLYGLL